MVELQRIERIVSNRGVGSRTEVSRLFRQGKVMVDGRVIRSGAEKISIYATITVEGRELQGPSLLAVYNKPVGVHCTMSDPWNRLCLNSLLKDYSFLSTMHPVGRLDTDTSGLLLFSSNGDLTQQLLHPSSGTEREYEAVVTGEIADFVRLRETLASGVATSEGTFPADILEARPASPEEIDGVQLTSLNSSTPPGCFSFVRLTVTEGKHRMVRRILHNCGHSVVKLHRSRYGNISLKGGGDAVLQGSLRRCSQGEMEWARQLMKSR